MSEKSLSYSNIDEYIALCPPETHAVLTQLRQAIHDVVPGTTEKISWGMPTFVYEGNLIHFALAKKHIGLFPGGAAVAAFAERCAAEGIDATTGTIRFSLKKPLPMPLIAEVVAFCAAENERDAAIKRATKKGAAAGSLAALPNMGKVTVQKLRAVGIETPEQLRKAGAKDAFLRVRAAVDPEACVQFLYGLQGAIEGIRDTLLSEETKDDLRKFADSLS